MNEVKLAVITPTYNRISNIPNAIKMLQSQILDGIEFIIVDDGSKDGSYELLQKLTQQDKRFTILKQENKGPSAARNNALAVAKGDYIGFFDIDDAIPQNYFDALYNEAIKSNADIVYTSYNNIYHRIVDGNNLESHIKNLRNGAIWDKIYKKSLIEDNNITFEEGLYTADNLWCIKTFTKAKKITLLNQPSYEYTLQSDSIGKDNSKQQKRKNDIFIIIDKILTYANQNQYTEDEINQLKYFLVKTYSCYPKDKKYQKKLYQTLGVPEPTLPKIPLSTKILLKFKKVLHIISKEEYKHQKELAYINHSSLFDEKWYISQNPDIANSNINPQEHYLKYGWKEGLNPSPKFDGNRYLQDNQDVLNANVCPLVHYLTIGAREGRFYDVVVTQ